MARTDGRPSDGVGTHKVNVAPGVGPGGPEPVQSR